MAASALDLEISKSSCNTLTLCFGGSSQRHAFKFSMTFLFRAYQKPMVKHMMVSSAFSISKLSWNRNMGLVWLLCPKTIVKRSHGLPLWHFQKRIRTAAMGLSAFSLEIPVKPGNGLV